VACSHAYICYWGVVVEGRGGPSQNFESPQNGPSDSTYLLLYSPPQTLTCSTTGQCRSCGLGQIFGLV